MTVLVVALVAARSDEVREQVSTNMDWTAVLDLKVSGRSADEFGKGYCLVVVSNKTDRTQKFKVWSE